MSILSPLALMAALRAEAPLFLTIRQADVDDDGNASNDEVIFFGEIVKAKIDGDWVTGTVVSAGSKFDRQITRVRYQRDCNNAWGDVACAINKDDWKFSAVIQDVGTEGYPFTFDLETLSGVGADATAQLANVEEGWFAGGWIQFGSGANTQRRAILNNTAPVSGELTLTLDRDPNPFPSNGDSVFLWPGCDGLPATCQVKFENYDNFLGFNFLPAGNPSLVKTQITGSGGKK